jgi:hypothetical protein
MPTAPVGGQLEQLRVWRDVTVVVELTDRDLQPVPVAHGDDRVGGEVTDFTGAQAGAEHQVDHDLARKLPGGVRGAIAFFSDGGPRSASNDPD